LKLKLHIVFIFLPILAFSQVREQELEEITIDHDLLLRLKPTFNFSLGKEQVVNKQAEDLGDLMRAFPGVSLKNYGGLGGLKTISARGINGTHSGIIVDGFFIQNTQTSQLDLGNVQLDNVQEIKLSYQNEDQSLQVVSAFFSANNLLISTFENQFSLDTLQLRANSKFGSFGQTDSYLSVKWNHKSWYLAAFGKFRKANGVFPYEVQNATEIIEAKRFNNDLEEEYSGVYFGKQFKNKSRVKFFVIQNISDKGLPGAVILYNTNSSQRLANSNVSFQADYKFKVKRQFGRAYASFRYDELKYIDSGYLNLQSYLKSLYFNSIGSFGAILKKNFNKSVLLYGVEENISFLQSNTNFDSIYRFHSKFILDYTILREKFDLGFTGGIQYIYNNSLNNDLKYEKFSFNPRINLSIKRFTFLGMFPYVYLKRTLRMPSFNELYYNQFGNTHLKPEIANQFSFGSHIDFNIHKNNFKITYNIYSNYIENKIVAIPTKNLFIWSIQNVGRVWINGGDLQFMHARNFLDKYKLESSFSYTFQSAVDVTKKSSATYQDQIAYIPKHILSGNFSFSYKQFGFNTSLYFNSLRYALNENITSNEVPCFYTLDANLFYKWKFKSNEIRFTFALKNITNNSYEYIRSYVMPGRYYLISLSYALH
jgi:vitamin B12 transporter